MRSFLETFGALALATSFCAACSGDTEETDPNTTEQPASLEEAACPDDSFLTYDNFGEPFLLTWCTGCHSSALPEGQRQGAPLSSNFDNLDDVRKGAGRIWTRAAQHAATMPPVGGPEDDQRELLSEWLACGAVEEAE